VRLLRPTLVMLATGMVFCKTSLVKWYEPAARAFCQAAVTGSGAVNRVAALVTWGHQRAPSDTAANSARAVSKISRRDVFKEVKKWVVILDPFKKMIESG